MQFIRTWVLSVTVASMVIAACEAIMPPGSVKRVGRLTGGLILVLAVLQPLVTLDYDDLYDLALPAGAVSQTSPYSSLAPVIEEELETYAVEQAAKLGCEVTVDITCTPGENEVPIPTSATITGDLTSSQRASVTKVFSEELGLSLDSIEIIPMDKEERQ